MTTSSAGMAHGLQLMRAGTAIAELTKVGDFELEVESIDVTNTNSGGWIEQKPGLKSVKDLEIEGNFRPDDTNGQLQLEADLVAGTESTFTIAGPSTMAFGWSFTAWVKGFALITPVAESKQAQFKAVLAVTSVPTLSVTVSGDLTGLSFSDGTLTPALTAGEYDYTNVTTSATTKVTATKTGATIKLYVDGTYIATLNSGEESAAFATADGSSHVVKISTKDSGKVERWYTIYVTNLT